MSLKAGDYKGFVYATGVKIVSIESAVTTLKSDVVDASGVVADFKAEFQDLSAQVQDLSTNKQDVITNLSSSGFLSAGSNITFDTSGSNITINSSGGGATEASMNEVFAEVADLSNQLLQLVELDESEILPDYIEFRLTGTPSVGTPFTVKKGTYLMYAQIILSNPAGTFNDTINDSIRLITFRFLGASEGAYVAIPLPVARPDTATSVTLNISGQYFANTDSEWTPVWSLIAVSDLTVSLDIQIDRMNLLRISTPPYSAD